MKLVATFLVIFLAVQTGTARHTAVKRGLIDWIIDSVKGLLDQVLNTVKKLLEGVTAALKCILTDLTKAVGGILDKVAGTVNGALTLVDGVVHDVKAALEKINDEKLVNELLAKLDTGASQIKDFINKIQTTIQTYAAEFAKNIEATMTDASNIVKGQLQKAADFINKCITEKWTNFDVCSKKYLPAMQTYSVQCLEDLKACASDATAKLKEVFGPHQELISKAQSLIANLGVDITACIDKQDFTLAVSVFAQLGTDITNLIAELDLCNGNVKAALLGLGAEAATCAAGVGKDAAAKSNEIIQKMTECCK